MSKIAKSLDVYGMHCKLCEFPIEYEVESLDGVLSASANYNNSNIIVMYENNLCDETKIKNTIKKSGYLTKNNSISNLFTLVLIIIAIIFLINKPLFEFDTNSIIKNSSFFMLFIIGILSSFHWDFICRGIIFTQTLNKGNIPLDKKSSFKIFLKYNLGRVITYTVLGGILGFLGSIFSLSIKSQGFIPILVSLFMILSGLNMIGFKAFKVVSLNFSFIKINSIKNSKNPFTLGILSYFIPYAHIQTIKLYALGTGDFVTGSLSMFIFALGMLPLMLEFDYTSYILSKSLHNKILKYSGIFIMLLAISMGQRGFDFYLYNTSSISSNNLPHIIDGYQQITITANKYNYSSSSNTIKGNIPVRLTIEVDQLTNCNSYIYFPKLNQYIDLSKGSIITEIITDGEEYLFYLLDGYA